MSDDGQQNQPMTVVKTAQGVALGIIIAVVVIVLVVWLYRANQISQAEELRRTFDEIAEQLDK
jgi:CDP-diglyceride synthetase